MAFEDSLDLISQGDLDSGVCNLLCKLPWISLSASPQNNNNAGCCEEAEKKKVGYGGGGGGCAGTSVCFPFVSLLCDHSPDVCTHGWSSGFGSDQGTAWRAAISMTHGRADWAPKHSCPCLRLGQTVSLRRLWEMMDLCWSSDLNSFGSMCVCVCMCS